MEREAGDRQAAGMQAKELSCQERGREKARVAGQLDPEPGSLEVPPAPF